MHIKNSILIFHLLVQCVLSANLIKLTWSQLLGSINIKTRGWTYYVSRVCMITFFTPYNECLSLSVLIFAAHFPDVLSIGPRELIQRVAKGYHDACEINALFKLLNWTRLQFLLWSFRFTFLLSAKGRFYFTKAETKIP